MTEVQMRNYLEGHFYASKKIKALEEERRQLRISAQGGAVSYEGNYTTTKANASERTLVRLADEEKKIADELDKTDVIMKKAIRKLCVKMC